MNHISLPGVRRKLHTNAARRWLIVSVYEGRPKVEASTDDGTAAGRLIARYLAEFGPGVTLHLVDQVNQTITVHGATR